MPAFSSLVRVGVPKNFSNNVDLRIKLKFPVVNEYSNYMNILHLHFKMNPKDFLIIITNTAKIFGFIPPNEDHQSHNRP